MSAMRLRIDRIAVELDDETRVAELEETLRKALALLAARLASVPRVGQGALERALDLVEVGPVDPEWLAGPGAAARLADELYGRIAGASR